MSFENTRFIIVGAAGGSGSALSRRLKRLGAEPIVMGRTGAKLAELGKELDAPTKAGDAPDSRGVEPAVTPFVPCRGGRLGLFKTCRCNSLLEIPRIAAAKKNFRYVYGSDLLNLPITRATKLNEFFAVTRRNCALSVGIALADSIANV